MLKLEALKTELPEAKETLTDLEESLGVQNIRETLADLKIEMETEGFWNDIDHAQKRMKLKGQLENSLNEYRELAELLNETEVLVEMAEESDDEEFANEALDNQKKFNALAEDLRIRTLLTEEYDSNNAIVTIHPGTGGTDAQDWAEMLLRMYTRWAEGKGYKIKILDYQRDTEGGIKNVEFLVEGDLAYGLLKTERGVHRLVRISPYNTAGKRQTSFASVEVVPELPEDIVVEIDPGDLKIDTFRASGAGGQYVNKTESAVRITHLPTNIVVSCQQERSQIQNREYAMRMLYAKLYALAREEKKAQISDLKGNYGQITWGNQIRSYVFQPYTMVKDHRTDFETSNVQAVMDGDIDGFINASLNALKRGELSQG